MRPGRPSRTAEAAAAVRAAEAARPVEQRLLDDRYARRFVTSPLWRALLAVPPVTVRALEWYDRRLPGVASWILLRAVFAEDVIVRECGRGLEQIVFVGAGYDTTAFRVGVPTHVRVLELDHPTTQQVKRRVLGRGLPDGAPARRLGIVACDLGRDDLAGALATAGFEPARRSLFVFLGVSMFLDQQTASDAVASMAALLSPGGLLLQDHVSGAASGSSGAEAAEAWAATRGEPWRSTWVPGAMEGVLAAEGLAVTQAHTARELGVRYGAGKPSARRAAEWVSVLLAEKPGPAGAIRPAGDRAADRRQPG